MLVHPITGLSVSDSSAVSAGADSTVSAAASVAANTDSDSNATEATFFPNLFDPSIVDVVTVSNGSSVHPTVKFDCLGDLCDISDDADANGSLHDTYFVLLLVVFGMAAFVGLVFAAYRTAEHVLGERRLASAACRACFQRTRRPASGGGDGGHHNGGVVVVQAAPEHTINSQIENQACSSTAPVSSVEFIPGFLSFPHHHRPVVLGSGSVPSTSVLSSTAAPSVLPAQSPASYRLFRTSRRDVPPPYDEPPPYHVAVSMDEHVAAAQHLSADRRRKKKQQHVAVIVV